MTFTSIKYLLFLAAAILYYVVPKKLQNGFLLLASLVFYMWAVPQYGILVLFTVGLCYLAGLLMEKHEGKKNTAIFVSAIAIVLGILFVFKYYNFFLDILGIAKETARLSLALPVGISFYTFTVIGYLADIKTGKTKAERNFIDFALFALGIGRKRTKALKGA